MKIKNNKTILLFGLIMMVYSCKNEKPVCFVRSIDSTLVQNNLNDTLWENSIPFYLNYYYGEHPKNKQDFEAYFKVFKSNKKIYFLIVVKDDIKYTHLKPNNNIDLPLWKLEDYDRVNIKFDVNDNGIINFEEGDIGISMNYGIDSICCYNINKNSTFMQCYNTFDGYKMKCIIPTDLFKNKKINFNIVITDNDHKFKENGYDVFERWESEFGWGVNTYNEDICRRFGLLIFDE
jgi:hypothetical protein